MANHQTPPEGLSDYPPEVAAELHRRHEAWLAEKRHDQFTGQRRSCTCNLMFGMDRCPAHGVHLSC